MLDKDFKSYQMDLMKVIPPKALNELFKTELSGLEGFNDEKMHQVSKAFYERFNASIASDHLASPFRKDIFIELGAYLKSFKTEVISDSEEYIFHFEFYLLDEPIKLDSFSLSSVADAEIVKSKAKFSAFVKDRITAYSDKPGALDVVVTLKMQSMETAPKDGSIILLETGQGYFTAKWMGEYTDGWAPCRWQMMKGDEMSRFGNLYEEVEEPTGWALLKTKKDE
jgi:hypothetical protein